MKRFLLDTNVISELVLSSPNKNLLSWLTEQEENRIYLSVITIAEIMRGVAKLDDSKKKKTLYKWVQNEIPKKFMGRILDFDQEAAFLWGQWQGEGDRIGKPKSIMDTQIAAIAVKFKLTLVTRNTKDFTTIPVKIFNPF